MSTQIESKLNKLNYCQEAIEAGKANILIQTALDKNKEWFANEYIALKLEGGKYVLDVAKNNVKTCPRCDGTGRYSYNLKDGDVCYGCGGTGKVYITPKGQAKVKPTCNSVAKAVVGDILEINCVLYRVESITWIKHTVVGKTTLTRQEYNQKLIVTRLVDEKPCKLYRRKVGSDGYATHPTKEMIGQEA